MPLTAKKVANAKPGRHSDGGGLYLLVKPSGARSWTMRVQYNGERKDYGIGSAVVDSVKGVDGIPLERRSSLTLAEAREKCRRGREIAKSGLNPQDVWRETEDEVPTFEQAARRYHKQLLPSWKNGKHGAQWLTTLENYAFPQIGAKRVDEIDASDIHDLLEPIWLSKAETARRVRQRTLSVLDFSHGRKWRDTEAPARALGKLLQGKKQPKGGNFEAMPYHQAPAFYAKLEGLEYSTGTRALQFLMLTVPRSGEVRKARFRDVVLKERKWWVPPLNAKLDKPHLIPLTDSAIEILERQREIFGGDPDQFVFPGLKGMMSNATMAKVLKVHGGEGFTVHGFRSTFRDWAAETGQPDEWAKKALAHGNPDKVEAAYLRTVYFNQRRDILMPAWEAHLMGANK